MLYLNGARLACRSLAPESARQCTNLCGGGALFIAPRCGIGARGIKLRRCLWADGEIPINTGAHRGGNIISAREVCVTYRLLLSMCIVRELTIQRVGWD